MERFEQLDDVLRSAWNLLFRSTVQRNDPFRTPVLTTINDDLPNARTVVLRSVDTTQRTLVCYTDYRSAKVAELQTNSETCWVFWNATRKIQIRAYGAIAIHHNDEVAKAQWQKIPVRNRKDYSTKAAPGTIQVSLENQLPDFWNESGLDIQKTEHFFESFVVLACEVTKIDWLHLHREGHQRALFTWQSEQWNSDWLVP